MSIPLLLSQADTLVQSGQLAEAIPLYEEYLAQGSNNANAWNSYGCTLGDLGRFSEALDCFNECVRLTPDYETARLNRGVVQQKMANEAVNQGVVLYNNKELEAALVCFERALSLYPAYSAANINAALILKELGRLDEAVVRLIASEKLEPGYVDGLNHAGDILLLNLKLYKEALDCYQRSLALKPDQLSVRHTIGCISHSLLISGQYAEGWQAYDDVRNWNNHNNQNDIGWIDFPQPQWRGQPLAGKRVLLWSEQGYGDVFQFCRYAHLVRDLGATVFLLVYPELERLFQTAFAQENITIGLGRAPAEPFDFQCPLSGLPLACKTDSLKKIPNQHPYLIADAAGIQHWHQRLLAAGGARKRRVGLVWAGGHRPQQTLAQGMDLVRSLHLRELASLETVQTAKEIQFFSLQLDAPAKQLAQMQSEGWSGPAMIDLTKELHDWADTAALIANLDLVISCDTAVAHLAAAMGKPTWILSCYSGCWRWLENRTDSPWYPSVRLFRQPTNGDWETVIQEVARALAEYPPTKPINRALPAVRGGAYPPLCT